VIFISHSRKDILIAEAVCTGLENNSIRCWIEPRDILYGEDFPKSIINAIDKSKILVLIFSAYANSSPHVICELSRAVEKGIIIVPFRIEPTPMTKSMEYLIGLSYGVDAIIPPMEIHIEELVRRISILQNKNDEKLRF
jgi:hypothetical protein